jgi:hypothetical protein
MSMTEPTVLGSGSGQFVKARELMGAEFTINGVRQGESNYGPSYYLDLTLRDPVTPEEGAELPAGSNVVLGSLVKSAIGGQCAKFGPQLEHSTATWTIIQRESKKFKDEKGEPKPVYLLAFFEGSAAEPTPASED